MPRSPPEEDTSPSMTAFMASKCSGSWGNQTFPDLYCVSSSVDSFVPGRSCNAVGMASSTNMFHAENTSRIRQKSSNFPFGMQTMSEYPKTTG